MFLSFSLAAYFYCKYKNLITDFSMMVVKWHLSLQGATETATKEFEVENLG